MKMNDNAARLPTIPPTTTGVDGVFTAPDPTTPTAVSEGLEVSLAAVGSIAIVVRRPPGKVAVVKVAWGFVIPESAWRVVESSEDSVDSGTEAAVEVAPVCGVVEGTDEVEEELKLAELLLEVA